MSAPPLRLLSLLVLPALGCAHAPKTPPADPGARIERCRATLAASVGAPAGQIASIYATSCADLYAAPACAAAWRAWPTVAIEARVATVALACREASCPDLPAPRPALCDAPDPDAAAIRAGWPALHRAILAHDLDMDPAAVDKFQADLALLVTPPTGPARAPGPVASQPDLVIDAGGVIIPFPGGFTMLNAPFDPANLRARLTEHLSDCRQKTFVIAVPPDVNSDVLQPVLTVLQEAGCDKVRMEIQPQR